MAVDKILKDLNSIKNQALRSMKMVRSRRSLDSARLRYLGKKGRLTEAVAEIQSLSAEERPLLQQTVESVQAAILHAADEKESSLKSEEQETQILEESVDISLPGSDWRPGTRHPVSQTAEQITDFFVSMGFGVVQGPNIESDYNNFEALNVPRHHPARDLQAPFTIDKDTVLRTHLRPAQFRALLEHKPPVALVCSGKAYRREAADMTHAHMFHQVEGLMVDSAIRFSDMKGIVEAFVHEFFGADKPFRFRPAYYPSTEPSCEVEMPLGDVDDLDGGQAPWLGVLGAGLIHPAVFEAAGYNPKDVSGFAFCIGVERTAMVKYGINDIRLLYDNDLRFLRQF
jgi:phenylalanyl-tRNA synthetase alpha chain